MNAAIIKTKIVDYIWSYDPCKPGGQSRWRHFLQIMSLVGRDIMGGMLNLRSMGLVYTTLLAFVPLLAVTLAVLKGFGVHDQLQPALTSLLAPLGERSVEFSARIVAFVENTRIGVLGAVSFSLLIYTVVSLIQKIESAFNQTWRITTNRNMLQRFSKYLSVIMVGPLLVFLALGITASLASSTIVSTLNELPLLGDTINALGKVVPYALIIGAFTFIYILVPNTKVRLMSAFYGALVAGILWQSVGILFTSFVGGSSSYTVIYSGFAILLLFIIWLNLCWLILLIGASISYYHQHPERLRWRSLNVNISARMREQLALQLMLNIAREHDQPSKTEMSIDNLARYQEVPVEILRPVLDALEGDDLVLQSAGETPEYLPARSISRIRLVDILRSSREADGTDSAGNFYCDESISKVLGDIESCHASVLGDRTLAQLLESHDGGKND